MQQANPRLATTKDDDERLPIHWALSNTHEAIVQLLVSRKDFDPDVQVRLPQSFLLYPLARPSSAFQAD